MTNTFTFMHNSVIYKLHRVRGINSTTWEIWREVDEHFMGNIKGANENEARMATIELLIEREKAAKYG
jgi:hypothetical protein